MSMEVTENIRKEVNEQIKKKVKRMEEGWKVYIEYIKKVDKHIKGTRCKIGGIKQ